MLIKKINTLLTYLIQELNCNKAIESDIGFISKNLLDGHLIHKTEFEFSLKIIGNRISNSLRFVNFDNHSNSSDILYRKRIELLEGIIFSYQNNKAVVRLFKNITEIKRFRLPLYLGLETKDTEIIFKLYLNFYAVKDELLRRSICRGLLNGLNFNFNFKKKSFPLVGFDLDQKEGIKLKIYYLYDIIKDRWYLSKYCFSEREKAISNFLSNFNKNNYFVISERYSKDMCYSKKIEIGIKENIDYINFINGLFRISNCYDLRQQILDMIKISKGRINVVIIEDKYLTLYIRIPRVE